MILEERDYHVRPGYLNDFVTAYETLGLQIQKDFLGEFVGYFTTDIGELNHVVALWRYESFADREQRRAKMMAHGPWQDYLTAIKGMLERQNTRILVPTAFSPMK
ncbi:NIPSNAP family protein [Ancylobacter pratisalsi]|uniref:NIPSNAP family protein n=1 Tax=Ancylobacter pratisalsi TaxID=1745854 RepID=A0A6P1YLE3_9HYPH|nr:NIPSNAP family protein [Ancylobacter pratisalsi]QIB33955.1 NIPSNAP family protein [Ancylobacter pratisalsi]